MKGGGDKMGSDGGERAGGGVVVWCEGRKGRGRIRGREEVLRWPGLDEGNGKFTVR